MTPTEVREMVKNRKQKIRECISRNHKRLRKYGIYPKKEIEK